MIRQKLKIICKHLTCMICLSIAMLYIFFYIVLPHITNQGKTVPVPDLTGIHIDALHAHVKQYHVNYIITDTNCYSSQAAPFTVLKQFPLPGALVKKNRKIYLTLNAASPPSVHMPNLIEGSIKQAQLLLKNKGLVLGQIKYIPDIAKYAVLEQWHNGKPIATGELITKGSMIDLVIGAGLGKQIIEVPDVIHMPLEEANFIILERGMRMGIVHSVQDETIKVGYIARQNPAPNTKVPLGTTLHLWVVRL